MPRVSRCVFPNMPHHITQRGNRREDVFFDEDDRTTYLCYLKDYCEKHNVEIIAYCLMTNHIHIVAVPETEDGLKEVFRTCHMRHAQKINKKKGWKGHLWQGRFFSSVLDRDYFWECIRYVENNPVRAKMVKKAEEYKWSSARHYCKIVNDEVITKKSEWNEKRNSINNWSKWLREKEDIDKIDKLRRNTLKGLPCGSNDFIKRLERIKDRILSYRPVGRPRKSF